MFEPARAGNPTLRMLRKTFYQSNVVLGIAHDIAEIDLAWRLGKLETTAAATQRRHVAELAERLNYFHQMAFGNSVNVCDFPD